MSGHAEDVEDFAMFATMNVELRPLGANAISCPLVETQTNRLEEWMRFVGDAGWGASAEWARTDDASSRRDAPLPRIAEQNFNPVMFNKTQLRIKFFPHSGTTLLQNRQKSKTLECREALQCPLAKSHPTHHQQWKHFRSSFPLRNPPQLASLLRSGTRSASLRHLPGSRKMCLQRRIIY